MAKRRSKVSRMDRKLTKPSKLAKPRAKASRQKWSASRRNTHKTNGALPESQAVAPEPVETVTVGEAMRRAEEALGQMRVIPDLAVQQIEELGTCYVDVARRQAAYDTKAEETKTARKSLESAKDLLMERVKAFAFPEPLAPLLDLATREEDQAEMLDAVEQGGEIDSAEAPPF